MKRTYVKQNIELDKLYSVTELSGLLQQSRQNTLRHIKLGHLKAIRLGLRTYGIYGRDVKQMYDNYCVNSYFNFI